MHYCIIKLTELHVAKILVGICFVALALYINYDSAILLLHKEAPERNLSGILLVMASLIIMSWLAHEKRNRILLRKVLRH